MNPRYLKDVHVELLQANKTHRHTHTHKLKDSHTHTLSARVRFKVPRVTCAVSCDWSYSQLEHWAVLAEGETVGHTPGERE